MQESAAVLLAMLLGHLLGDFVFQTERSVAGKQELRWSAYLRHGMVHYLAVVGCLATLASVPPVSWRTQRAVLILIVAHIAVDVGKSLVPKTWQQRHPLVLFLVDQVAHVAIVALIGWSILLGHPLPVASSYLAIPARASTLAIAVAYVAVVFAGGQLIRIALIPFAGYVADETEGDHLADAGLYIGRLERFLVLTAILIGSYTSVGLIVAAKSIFRFPEMKDRPSAEYFLIGTLLSISVAVIGAIALRWSSSAPRRSRQVGRSGRATTPWRSRRGSTRPG